MTRGTRQEMSAIEAEAMGATLKWYMHGHERGWLFTQHDGARFFVEHYSLVLATMRLKQWELVK